MITSRFALALKELNDSRMSVTEIIWILKLLEVEARSLDIENTPMQFVAAYIHQLYIPHQSSRIKSTLIMICGRLESVAKESILERYHFDKIVALAIEQSPIQHSKSDEDEIRMSAFFVVSVMLRMRRSLPKTILRSLANFYAVTSQPSFKPLILNYLLETVVMTSSAERVPEIGTTLVDAVLDVKCHQQDSILKVLCYGLEKRGSFIHNSFLVWRLLAPLSPMPVNEKEAKVGDDVSEEKQERVCNVIVSVLQNWAGVFAFGLKMNGFKSILMCLRHKESYVVRILSRLLKLDVPRSSVLESYTGFILLILKQNGLLEKLSEVTERSVEAAKFLASLMPYCSRYDALGLPKYIPYDEMEDQKEQNGAVDLDLVLMKVSGMPPAIKGFKLAPNPSDWNWNVIYLLLTVVLPNNTDCESDDAKAFYDTLFEFFFCGRDMVYKSNTNKHLMCECLVSLFDLLLSQSKGGVDVLSRAIPKLKPAFMIAVNKLNKGNVKEDEGILPWTFFRCLAKLVSTDNGLRVLPKDNLSDVLKLVGKKCRDVAVIRTMLEHLQFLPQPYWTWTEQICRKFLKKKDINVTKAVIEAFSAKMKVSPAVTDMFLFIVDSAKTMAADGNYAELQLMLGVMAEFLRQSTKCQEMACQLYDTESVLYEHSHTVFCQIFGSEEALTHIDISAEIDWWMTRGNLEYVDTWDSAVAASFNTPWCTTPDSIPSIIMVDGVAIVPTHLFGELSKHDHGRETLKRFIPELLEQLNSNNIKEQRAAAFALAHFASVPETEETVCKFNIARAIVSSLTSRNSYTLPGTAIACLSLFSRTHSFAKVLEDINWEELVYGPYSCVVPSDPLSVLPPRAENEDLHLGQPLHIDGNPEYVQSLIELCNPVRRSRQSAEKISDAAKSKLQMASRDKRDELLNPTMALAAGQLLGELNYSSEMRSFIYDKFRSTPFMKPPSASLDPESVAIVRALIGEAKNRDEIDPSVVFSELPIPKFELGQLPLKRPGVQLVPEVYLSDEDLEKALGTTRSQFYQLSVEEQAELRHRLLTSQ